MFAEEVIQIPSEGNRARATVARNFNASQTLEVAGIPNDIASAGKFPDVYFPPVSASVYSRKVLCP